MGFGIGKTREEQVKNQIEILRNTSSAISADMIYETLKAYCEYADNVIDVNDIDCELFAVVAKIAYRIVAELIEVDSEFQKYVGNTLYTGDTSGIMIVSRQAFERNRDRFNAEEQTVMELNYDFDDMVDYTDMKSYLQATKEMLDELHSRGVHA